MYKEWLYKITLYDRNCSPVSDNTAMFFTRSLDEFEKEWLATERVDEECYERFQRSKQGELVSDYYITVPELNIVQKENVPVFAEKKIILLEDDFFAENAYGYREKYHVDKMDVVFRWIRFDSTYFRIASWAADGVCMYDALRDKWVRAELYGNPILKYEKDIGPGWSGAETPKEFSQNRLKTFCFIVNDVFGAGEEAKKKTLENINNFKVTDIVKSHLFADVIGEAG